MKTLCQGKNLNIFVRFGGLNIKPQQGFGKDNYHAPPASKGFYAMPLIAQEMFLVGSLDKTQQGTLPKYPKDHQDWTEEQWQKFNKKREKALSLKRKQFLKKDGNIWHHLVEFVDRNEIITEHGYWCKTSIKAWQKAFSRMSLKYRYGEKIDSDWGLSTNSINNPARSGLMGVYSSDHCEVFFDEKV